MIISLMYLFLLGPTEHKINKNGYVCKCKAITDRQTDITIIYEINACPSEKSSPKILGIYL